MVIQTRRRHWDGGDPAGESRRQNASVEAGRKVFLRMIPRFKSDQQGWMEWGTLKEEEVYRESQFGFLGMLTFPGLFINNLVSD